MRALIFSLFYFATNKMEFILFSAVKEKRKKPQKTEA